MLSLIINASITPENEEEITPIVSEEKRSQIEVLLLKITQEVLSKSSPKLQMQNFGYLRFYNTLK